MSRKTNGRVLFYAYSILTLAACNRNQLPPMPAGGFGPCDMQPMSQFLQKFYTQGVPSAVLTCNDFSATQGKYEGKLDLKMQSSGKFQGAPVQGNINMTIDGNLKFNVDGSSFVTGQSTATTQTKYNFAGIMGISGGQNEAPETSSITMMGEAKTNGDLKALYAGGSINATAHWQGPGGGGSNTGAVQQAAYTLPMHIEKINCDVVSGIVTDAEIQRFAAPHNSMGLQTTASAKDWSAKLVLDPQDEHKKSQADAAILKAETGFDKLSDKDAVDVIGGLIQAGQSIDPSMTEPINGSPTYAQCQAERVYTSARNLASRLSKRSR